MFQGECTVNLNNLFSKPSTPNLTWTNPRQSFLGNYDYASHFSYDNSSVSVRFHFLVCCSITFRCNVVDSGNMLFIQVKGDMDRFSFVLGICLVEFLAMVWLWALLSLSVGCVFVV